jgi:hypothetical protein
MRIAGFKIQDSRLKIVFALIFRFDIRI